MYSHLLNLHIRKVEGWAVDGGLHLQRLLEGKQVRKVIFVKDKILNFVVG